MDIDINKLDYSNYEMPCNINEDELKQILSCCYNDAIQLSAEELINRINMLKEFIIINKKVENYRLEEWYCVGNMESNYRYALSIVLGEVNE